VALATSRCDTSDGRSKYSSSSSCITELPNARFLARSSTRCCFSAQLSSPSIYTYIYISHREMSNVWGPDGTWLRREVLYPLDRPNSLQISSKCTQISTLLLVEKLQYSIIWTQESECRTFNTLSISNQSINNPTWNQNTEVMKVNLQPQFCITDYIRLISSWRQSNLLEKKTFMKTCGN
jgi:hypothetical protein